MHKTTKKLHAQHSPFTAQLLFTQAVSSSILTQLQTLVLRQVGEQETLINSTWHLDYLIMWSNHSHTGELVSAKIIRNKYTGQSEGYGFMEFVSRSAAEKMMQNYNGTLMPNTEQVFRMNWASFSMGERRLDGGLKVGVESAMADKRWVYSTAILLELQAIHSCWDSELKNVAETTRIPSTQQ